MRLLSMATALLVVAPISNYAQPAQQELWRYPCDMIIVRACLRLPTGMIATYEVPADYGLYEISRAGHRLVSVYVGSSPDRSKALSDPTLSLRSRDHRLTGFISNEGSGNNIDVFITRARHRPNESVIHLRAKLTVENRDSISLIFSGLRPCVARTREKLICELESEWGQEISAWVSAAATQE